MKTINKTICVLLFLFGAYSGLAQHVPINTFLKTVEEMAAFNIYETTCTVGYSNSYSTQYERYKFLTQVNSEDLILLASTHKNPVVRLYAFQAIKKRNIEIPQALIEKFKNDASEVISLQGCLAENTTVNKLNNEIFLPLTTYKLGQQ